MHTQHSSSQACRRTTNLTNSFGHTQSLNSKHFIDLSLQVIRQLYIYKAIRRSFVRSFFLKYFFLEKSILHSKTNKFTNINSMVIIIMYLLSTTNFSRSSKIDTVYHNVRQSCTRRSCNDIDLLKINQNVITFLTSYTPVHFCREWQFCPYANKHAQTQTVITSVITILCHVKQHTVPSTNTLKHMIS